MIPKCFHFIWISKDFMKEQNKTKEWHLKVIRSYVLNNPEYKIIVWDNFKVRALVEVIKISQLKVFEILIKDSTLLAQKTDIIRMIILNSLGGIYCDFDTLCLDKFDDLLYYDFFIGEEKVKEKSHMHDKCPVASNLHYINNTVIGSIKGHKIFDIYFDLLPTTENKVRTSLGPKLCEESIFNYKLQKENNVKILSNDVFFSSTYFMDTDVVNLNDKSKIMHFYGGTSKDGK